MIDLREIARLTAADLVRRAFCALGWVLATVFVVGLFLAMLGISAAGMAL